VAYVHGDVFLFVTNRGRKEYGCEPFTGATLTMKQIIEKSSNIFVPLPDNSVTSSWIVQLHPPKVTVTPGLAKEEKG